MASIPGLSVCPVEGSGSGIQLPTFSGNIFIPESHRYGHCPPLNEYSMFKDSPIVGQYGVIYKCIEKKSNKIFALKLFKMPEDLIDGIPSSVLREITILKTLKMHPNIINSHGTVAGRELNRNYLVLDYCEFTLKELFDKNIEAIFDRAMVKFFMYHILLGLEYIHNGLIIHRDMCLKNIMFTKDGILKIGGFRASRFYNRGTMTPGITELNYRAPELLMKSTIYGPAVDMWSVGCIFAELLLKRPLFSGTSESELLKSIFLVLGTPTETIWPGFTDLFSAFGNEEGGLGIEREMLFRDMANIFGGETVACQKLLDDLLIYFPNVRASARDCLFGDYFKEIPKGATTEDLSKVLLSLLPDTASNETMEM